MKDQKTTIITYHGPGNVSSAQAPYMPADDETIDYDDDLEEDPTSPFFRSSRLETAIVKRVMSQVQQSQQ